MPNLVEIQLHVQPEYFVKSEKFVSAEKFENSSHCRNNPAYIFVAPRKRTKYLTEIRLVGQGERMEFRRFDEISASVFRQPLRVSAELARASLPPVLKPRTL